MQTALSINVLSQQRAFMGVKVTAQKPAAVRATRVVVRAEEKAAEAEAKSKKLKQAALTDLGKAWKKVQGLEAINCQASIDM